MTNAPDADGKWLYRAGGLSSLAIGAGYIFIVGLYVRIGAPPSGVEARLAYLAKNTATWWALLTLSVLTDVLFVPLALSLYAALKEINRSVMMLATASVALFVFLDLALTWTNYAALIKLSGNYVHASSDVERAAVITVATYPAVVLESSLLFFYNSLSLALGILLSGVVMRKGIFSKKTAYLGMVTGLLGVASVVGPLFFSFMSVAIVFTSILTTIWAFLVGFELYRLGSEG